MNTFLPYSNFDECARVIDNKRLWKQILEADGLIRLILDQKVKSHWRNHPCYKMWQNHPKALTLYRNIFVNEWMRRRLFLPPFINLINQEEQANEWFPSWLGNKTLHLSHQSNLVRKNPECYRKFFPDVPDNIPYYWP